MSRPKQLNKPKPVKVRIFPLVFFLLILVTITIIAPLTIHTKMAEISYEIRDLRIELNEQALALEEIQNQILLASSTESLVEKAKELGMVQSGTPGVISLEKEEVTQGQLTQ